MWNLWIWTPLFLKKKLQIFLIKGKIYYSKYSSLQIIKYVYLYFKGTLVMTLKASDGDEGDPRNITYSLVTSMYANLAHHRFIFSLLFFINVAKFYKIT